MPTCSSDRFIALVAESGYIRHARTMGVSLVNFRPLIDSGETENLRRDQGGRQQVVPPAQAPDLLPSASAIDEQITEAETADAGTARA